MREFTAEERAAFSRMVAGLLMAIPPDTDVATMLLTAVMAGYALNFDGRIERAIEKETVQ